MVSAACSGDDGDAATAATSDATTIPADCTPSREATDGDLTLSYGREERTYSLALPAGYDGGTALPLVFSLHGFASDKETMEAGTGLARAGAARGYIVATPDATGPVRQFNYFRAPDQADDFGFVHALLAELSDRLCVDEDRVFAAGHSAGSAFAAFLVCQEPYVFAAIAMVSATTPSGCPDGVTPAIVAVAGTADPQVPYAGGSVGGSAVGIPPAIETIEAYATRHACASGPASDQPATNVERITYSECADGRTVVLYTVVGGGHEWAAGPEFSATDAILDFFDGPPAALQ